MTLVKTKQKSKIPASQKKRSGLHHRRDRSYTKAYWPYIPIVIVFSLGLVLNSWLSSRPKVLGASSNFSVSALLNATNSQRSAYNQPSYELNSQLDAAAQTKANDMVTKNYWSHNTPSGQTPWSFITSAGYNYQLAGENLAYGFNNASQVISGWMNSPEHRANILDSGYKDVGFGVASSVNYLGHGPEVLVVAIYAEPLGAAGNISSNGSAPNSVLGQTTSKSPSGTQTPESIVSRVQLMTGGRAIWSLTALSFATGIGLCLFVVRHSRRLKRLVIDGERIIVKHYALDIILAIVISIGFILTRSGGVIR